MKNGINKKKAPTPDHASSEARNFLLKAIDGRANPLKVSVGECTTLPPTTNMVTSVQIIKVIMVFLLVSAEIKMISNH